MDKQNVLLFGLFGPPGSGKGTQAKRLIKRFDLVHVSTGDLCRAKSKEHDALGVEIKFLISHGKFVPDDIIIMMFEEHVHKHMDAKGFVFDGFPRNVSQIPAFELFLTKHFPGIPFKPIALHVHEQELMERLFERAKVEGRHDDTPETIRQRIQLFNTTTLPVIKHYQEKLDVPQIVGTGKQADDVWKEILQLIHVN